MTPFVASAVLSTAVTDFLNGVILLAVFFLLKRQLPTGNEESRHWLRFVLMASVSCVLGALTHCRLWGFWMMFFQWLVLNIAIMETAHSFFMLGACTLSGGTKPRRKQLRYLRIFEVIVQIIMVGVMLVRWHPIQLLVVFAVLLVIPGLGFVFCLAIRGHKGARILNCFILPLIPCIVLQVMGLHEEKVLGSLNVDGLCHLFILADIPIVYIAARKWSAKKEN